MKILILNTLYSPYQVGGAEKSVQLLAENYVNLGCKVRVITLTPEDKVKIFFVNGVEVIQIPIFNLYFPVNEFKSNSKLKKIIWHLLDIYNPVMALRIKKYILEFKPTVIHMNNLSGFSFSVINVCNKYCKLLVHTYRDYYPLDYKCTMYRNDEKYTLGFFSKIRKKLMHSMAKKISVHVFISEYVKNVYIKNLFVDRESRTKVIYNPINGNIDVNHDYSNSFDKIKVGFIGRLSSEKGFDIFCEFAQKYQKMEFIAAGNCENSSLIELAKRANVSIVGYMPFDQFSSLVDVFMLPIQWEEPFGRVVAESALTGKHVFTNKVGGITEIFDFFDNIYTINEFSYESCMKKNNYIVNNPFSPEQHAREYLDLFECYM